MILGCCIGVIAWVMTTDVDDDVALPEDEKAVIEPIARYGLGGRGAAAALVGIDWISAAMHREPSKARELCGALQTVRQNSRGWLLLLPLGSHSPRPPSSTLSRRYTFALKPAWIMARLRMHQVMGLQTPQRWS